MVIKKWIDIGSFKKPLASTFVGRLLPFHGQISDKIAKEKNAKINQWIKISLLVY